MGPCCTDTRNVPVLRKLRYRVEHNGVFHAPVTFIQRTLASEGPRTGLNADTLLSWLESNLGYWSTNSYLVTVHTGVWGLHCVACR
jgi:hypothetical protein